MNAVRVAVRSAPKTKSNNLADQEWSLWVPPPDLADGPIQLPPQPMRAGGRSGPPSRPEHAERPAPGAHRSSGRAPGAAGRRAPVVETTQNQTEATNQQAGPARRARNPGPGVDQQQDTRDRQQALAHLPVEVIRRKPSPPPVAATAHTSKHQGQATVHTTVPVD